LILLPSNLLQHFARRHPIERPDILVGINPYEKQRGVCPTQFVHPVQGYFAIDDGLAPKFARDVWHYNPGLRTTLCRGNDDLEVATRITVFGTRRKASCEKVVSHFQYETDVFGLFRGM
jgi:hypothetical protein